MTSARIALDLLGGDHAPDAVVAGALAAVAADAALAVTLVGPPDLAAAALERAGAAPDALPVAPASEVVGMHEDPARGVRSKRDATVRVAAALVRDGAADAMVSVGSTGAAMAAALFTLGRLPGVTRPALAVAVPAVAGPVVLLDVGANTEAGPDLIVQHALAGAAYARVLGAAPDPSVGLLSVGTEPGKGDTLRKEAGAALAALDVSAGGPLRYAGLVEPAAVPLGGAADVVVTDGFTGNVLLKGLEAMLAAVGRLLADAGAPAGPLAEATAGWSPDAQGGGVLLGVDGVVVIGHGAAGPGAVAAAIAAAAAAARADLVPRLRTELEALVARRRAAAGLPQRSAPNA